MNQRLFQDAAGTTPAIIAGQPVGLIKRLAGSVDAVQATALSKPTLARWPKTGVRNLAMGAQAVGVGAHWLNSQVINGVTATKVGHGIEDGLPYVDYRFEGTITTANGQVPTAYVHSGSAVPAMLGDVFNASVIARLIAGVIPPDTPSHLGLRVQIEGRGSATTYIEGGASAVGAKGATDVVLTKTHTITAEQTVAARVVVMLQGVTGMTVDYTYRIKGLELTRNTPLGPLQFNYGPNDIIESGVADLWHLYNDGGDSLNVILPAGTYGLASIDINREITITTITSDGTTPINTLRHERQLDVILRAGAFTSGEETAIRDYWGRVFA